MACKYAYNKNVLTCIESSCEEGKVILSRTPYEGLLCQDEPMMNNLSLIADRLIMNLTLFVAEWMPYNLDSEITCKSPTFGEVLNLAKGLR